MRTFLKRKLGRDKIITIMQELGARVVWRVLSDREYDTALRAKLLEETLEVEKAQSRAELVAELADLYEVIDALKTLHGIPEEAIRVVQTKKRDDRGDFSQRLYIETTSYPEGSYWEKYCLANPDKFPEVDAQ